MKEFNSVNPYAVGNYPGGGGAESQKVDLMKNVSGVLLSLLALIGSVNSAVADEDTRPVTDTQVDNSYSNIDSINDVIFKGVDTYGGAIYNFEGEIGTIKNVLIENTDGYGIYNNAGSIDSIKNVVFKLNKNSAFYQSPDYTPSSVESMVDVTFLNNSYYWGGAIYNEGGTINYIKGDFIENSAEESGGAIYNSNYNDDVGTISKIIDSNFINNYVSFDYNDTRGGAIYNEGDITLIENSSFVGNYAEAEPENGVALGGAIYTIRDMKISANAGDTVFKDNYVKNGSSVESNAIYVGTSSEYLGYEDGKSIYKVNSAKITLSSTNGGTILINDKIDGELTPGSEYSEEYNEETWREEKVYLNDELTTYTLAIEGDSDSKVILNNDVKNGNVTLKDTNLYLGRENVLDNAASFTVNSGNLNLVNGSVGTMNVPVFNLAGTTNLALDVDLAAKSMDRITADKYNVTDGAYLNVNYLNLLSDAAQDKTSILFADSAYAKNVAYTGANPVAYSPIHKYAVSYNPDDGFFTFMRGGSSGGGNSSDNYNPSVLPTPVTTQAGAYTTQLQTFNYAFQHVDTFMALPYMERMAIRNQNRYALSPTGDATDVGNFSPLFTKSEQNGFWVKPYSSFENIPLKNGPKVSNINYGTLIGYDSNLQSIKYGIDRVLTGYIGYNGASQRFQGVDSYQNGGILGGTVTMYKGNFFNASTLSVGATAGTNSGMYGSEDYTMLLAGFGNKFGYNYEMLNSKLILQPSMLMSYTFVNTFDYKNAAGVRINSDPLNALQLAPGIKIIGNLENGWQPYLAVNMIWNILDKTKVMADDVRLPSMSIKPYIEYGAGIQKRWAKDYTAYLQAMVRNGGRNGVSLTAGFRWSVGKK